MARYNVKQLTNYDVNNNVLFPPERFELIEINDVEVPYVTLFNVDTKIVKLGYCCEMSGINLPIFLKVNDNNNYTLFNIGRDCMFEMQPENGEIIKTYNSDMEKESDVMIRNVKVPAEIAFTFDYVLLLQ